MSSGIIYFSLFFLCSLFELMSVSINGNYIAKTFYEMPPTVVKNATYPINASTGFDPYFNVAKFKSEVIDYLDRNLESKIDKYTIGFVCFKYSNGNYSITYQETCDAVDIKFSCKYSGIFTFTGDINFEVKGVYANGWEPS